MSADREDLFIDSSDDEVDTTLSSEGGGDMTGEPSVPVPAPIPVPEAPPALALNPAATGVEVGDEDEVEVEDEAKNKMITQLFNDLVAVETADVAERVGVYGSRLVEAGYGNITGTQLAALCEAVTGNNFDDFDDILNEVEWDALSDLSDDDLPDLESDDQSVNEGEGESNAGSNGDLNKAIADKLNVYDSLLETDEEHIKTLKKDIEEEEAQVEQAMQLSGQGVISEEDQIKQALQLSSGGMMSEEDQIQMALRMSMMMEQSVAEADSKAEVGSEAGVEAEAGAGVAATGVAGETEDDPILGAGTDAVDGAQKLPKTPEQDEEASTSKQIVAEQYCNDLFQLPDCTIYTGECYKKEGFIPGNDIPVPNGFGTLMSESMDMDRPLYVGQYVMGLYEGLGKQYNYHDDMVVEGEFKSGRANGHCTFSRITNGFKYFEGNVTNGVPDGEGILWVRGREIHGPVFEMRVTGQGKIYTISPDGTRAHLYTGTIVNNMRHGAGTTIINGAEWTGEHVDDSLTGECTTTEGFIKKTAMFDRGLFVKIVREELIDLTEEEQRELNSQLDNYFLENVQLVV